MLACAPACQIAHPDSPPSGREGRGRRDVARPSTDPEAREGTPDAGGASAGKDDGGLPAEGEGGLRVDPAAGAFSIAVLPDTQNYLPQRAEVFDAQTAWLADNARDLDLRLAVHVGDVVNLSWDEESWRLARDAMAILDGTVPYLIAPGNHDYGATQEVENARDRSTRLHEFFPRALFEQMPTFGAFWTDGERVDNSFHAFEAGGEKWLVLALEFGPRQEAVDWAHEVLDAHADHRVLLTTHAYLYVDGQRYDWATHGEAQPWNPHSHRYGIAREDDVHDGDELWRELISVHSNVVAILCGHAHGNGSTSPENDGVARLETPSGGSDSVPVVQMLANYQDQPEGGGGFLRLLTVDPATRTIQVTTYSPYLDEEKRDEENAFRFAY